VAEPIREPGRGEARIIARSEGLIVYFCAEVARLDVGCYPSRIVFCAEEPSNKFVSVMTAFTTFVHEFCPNEPSATYNHDLHN
jgi:hypothetical protein